VLVLSFRGNLDRRSRPLKTTKNSPQSDRIKPDFPASPRVVFPSYFTISIGRLRFRSGREHPFPSEDLFQDPPIPPLAEPAIEEQCALLLNPLVDDRQFEARSKVYQKKSPLLFYSHQESPSPPSNPLPELTFVPPNSGLLRVPYPYPPSSRQPLTELSNCQYPGRHAQVLLWSLPCEFKEAIYGRTRIPRDADERPLPEDFFPSGTPFCLSTRILLPGIARHFGVLIASPDMSFRLRRSTALAGQC